MDLNMTIGKKKAASTPDSAAPAREPQRANPSGLPQIDLLPPEVRDGRRLSARRRVLIYCVLGVVAAVILAIAGTYLLKLNADNRLADAQDRSTQLVAEKKKYSEVTNVIKSINATKKVRDFSVVTEVGWADYIDAIAAQLPPGVTIDKFEVEQASPTSPAPDVSDPTLATGLGTISFSATSPTLPDASDWADALNIIPGLQDATILDSTLNEGGTAGGKGVANYTVSVTVQINERALAHREFKDREVGADTADAADSGEKK
ncbi:hypothetical protein GCM10010401_22560 [Rarobacter faecitabidus]|uniref:Tfp pilus assembly protein PilN n=1 Tax=Rarobacter faecitabidus TaxID=13243 RepID=A0A542ZVR7_RARFA|nr:hypothetical protein [Rarobacter faecitabidus]TQL64458.1 Tfp pilus assembly protein PilN [Rarobacter faecitabidus]